MTPANKTRKRRASQIDENKENTSPSAGSSTNKMARTLLKPQHDDSSDGQRAEQPSEQERDHPSKQAPSTPPSKITMPGIRDQRPTPGRKVPARGSPPNAFRPETDPKSMRNPSPLPPPAKKRMNALEKDERYRQEALRDPNHSFHDIYVCFKKGPRGSPTYDEAGFQLDYEKVAEWMKPKAYNKESIMRGMDRAIEQAKSDEARMAEIFFRPGTAPKDFRATEKDFWRDKVSKDLGIPFHKVDVKAFEEWEKRGFEKQSPSDWEWKGFSEEEKKRISRLQIGASLRK